MAVNSLIAEAVQILVRDPALPRSVVILEAGCGSTSDVVVPFEKTVVGIDIDPEQLKNNDTVDRKILGDLQAYELPSEEFDIVVCVDVLEHLPFPEKAIANMSGSLKPGGYLLIAGPELYSYKGLVAKYTPHSMRSFIFKALTGRAPQELRRVHGNGQIFIPTYLKPVCSRRNLAAVCKRHGLQVMFEKGIDGYSDSGLLRRAYRPLSGPVKLLTRSIEKITGGRINLLLADFVILFRRPSSTAEL